MFDDLLQRLKSPAERRFYGKIRDDHVLDKAYEAKVIAPNAAYFEIRLAEMFIANRSEYGRNFVPLAVIASEFIYGGASRSFPFVVGTEMLHDISSYVKGEDVSFLNTRVVGPVPYVGGDVALFAGVFRAQVDDFARKLLDVLGQVVGVFDISKLSSYVNIAGKLMDGLHGLLNMKEFEYRTGDRDVFQDHGSKPFATGYFAHVNCGQTAINGDNLWIKDGTLHAGDTPQSLGPLKGYDYCVIEIQSANERNDYTTLPFDQKFKEARAGLSRGDPLSQAIFVECCQQIADSSDLTPSHAEGLIQAYQANFAKAVEFYSRLRAPTDHVATVYRGDEDGPLKPQQSIRRTAKAALAAGVKEKTLQGLVDLTNNWNDLPHLDSPDAQVTDELLNAQLAKIGRYAKDRKPDPKGLANAIAIAAVTS